MAGQKKISKKSKIKKFIIWFKESWKEPKKRALLKLALYGVFFVSMFLLIIIIGEISKLINGNYSDENKCIGTFCDIKNNNYEYRLTINSYDDEEYMTYVELNGYKQGNNNYYSELTNEDTYYFKYIDDVIYQKVNDEWSLPTHENIYTNNDYIFLDVTNLELLINSSTFIDSYTSFDGTEKYDLYSLSMSDVSRFLSIVFQNNDIIEIDKDSFDDAQIQLTYKNDLINSISIDFKAINGKIYYIQYRNIDGVTTSLINENFK